MSERENILHDVSLERLRQNEKWGIQDHNLVEWIAILTEEVGEASKEAVDYHFNQDDWSSEKLTDCLERYRTELIQVAAVATQMVESLDRTYLNK